MQASQPYAILGDTWKHSGHQLQTCIDPSNLTLSNTDTPARDTLMTGVFIHLLKGRGARSQAVTSFAEEGHASALSMVAIRKCEEQRPAA